MALADIINCFRIAWNLSGLYLQLFSRIVCTNVCRDWRTVSYFLDWANINHSFQVLNNLSDTKSLSFSFYLFFLKQCLTNLYKMYIFHFIGYFLFIFLMFYSYYLLYFYLWSPQNLSLTFLTLLLCYCLFLW